MKRARADGRTSSQLRPLSASLGTLSGCDGSAVWSAGETCVAAGVQGPRPARAPRLEDSTGATLEVCISGAGGSGGGAVRALEAAVAAVLAPALASGAAAGAAAAPRACVTLALTVLRDGGALASAAVNAAVLALADAGVPLRGLVAAVDAAVLAGSGGGAAALLDPTSLEEAAAAAASGGGGGAAHAAYLWRGDDGLALAASTAGGAAGGEQLPARLRAASAAVHGFMRATLARKVARDAVCFGGADAVQAEAALSGEA